MKICGPLFDGLGAVFAQAAYLKRSKVILEVTSRTIKKPQGFQRLETGSSPPFKKPTSDTGGVGGVGARGKRHRSGIRSWHKGNSSCAEVGLVDWAGAIVPMRLSRAWRLDLRVGEEDYGSGRNLDKNRLRLEF